MSALPDLPRGRKWPAYMLADTPVHARLRANYARISQQVAANEDLAQDRVEALDMLKHAHCRVSSGGNPHAR